MSNLIGDDPLFRQRQEKILETEQFINERLKVDLQRVLEAREKIYDELSEYAKLREQVQLFAQQPRTKLTTLVNIGAAFYVQANVEDCTKLFVNIGLGFHVQLSPAEVPDFVQRREALLQSHAERFTKQAAEINMRIKLLLDALSQLMQLPAPGPQRQQRVVF